MSQDYTNAESVGGEAFAKLFNWAKRKFSQYQERSFKHCLLRLSENFKGGLRCVGIKKILKPYKFSFKEILSTFCVKIRQYIVP